VQESRVDPVQVEVRADEDPVRHLPLQAVLHGCPESGTERKAVLAARDPAKEQESLLAVEAGQHLEQVRVTWLHVATVAGRSDTTGRI
jgi:hypothetical protein